MFFLKCFITLKDTKMNNFALNPHTTIEQIIKYDKDGNETLDAHCWIEHNGKTIDYDDDDLRANSLFSIPNCKIIRRPFPEKLQEEIRPFVRKIANKRIKNLKTYSIEQQRLCMRIANTQVGYCIMKSLKYKQKNRDSKLIIGSLGFVGRDDKIRYEFG